MQAEPPQPSWSATTHWGLQHLAMHCGGSMRSLFRQPSPPPPVFGSWQHEKQQQHVPGDPKGDQHRPESAPISMMMRCVCVVAQNTRCERGLGEHRRARTTRIGQKQRQRYGVSRTQAVRGAVGGLGKPAKRRRGSTSGGLVRGLARENDEQDGRHEDPDEAHAADDDYDDNLTGKCNAI